MTTPADLWAITAYFNPARYQRRLANYHVFRHHLPLPLVTVELAFDAPFELGARDADLLIQCQGGDVMWQKERLLNIALRALPDYCRKVVWIDCDTLIGSHDWPERVSAALDHHPFLQPFQTICHLAAEAHPEEADVPGKILFTQPSIAWAVHSGRSLEDCLQKTMVRDASTTTKGVMFAMRRELLEANGLFDACIVGGGDSAALYAAYGAFENIRRNQRMNASQWDYYQAWAKPFYQTVRADVGYVDAPVYHLWHGHMRDRRYPERYVGLQPFHFDPVRDLAIAPSGAWRWNSDKPLLHQYVRDYFASRREDGA